ncbi:MAG TPA: amidohydrolase/deacetylase family metallohydrolase [Bryobacteraceae bacterium]|nr:amidohydrolase/deacetylase family metallohydrolase [Bryobacteraceae bacterium]
MIRRDFLRSLAAPAMLPALAPPQPRYDTLIRNGEVLDPDRRIRKRADVAVRDGKIAALDDSLPAGGAADVIDATGLYVVPGLIDLHTHCCHAMTGLSIEADPIAARSGVTTWVDAGSFGADQADGFRRFVVRPQQARVFGFIHQYPNMRNPDVDPVKYAHDEIRRTGAAAEANRDIILGIKVYVGSNMNGRYSLDFLKAGRELCDRFKVPMMAHISFAPPNTPEVMELMRAGDVVTHCFNAHTLGILDAAGKPKPSVTQARARGVLFDVGHGAGSFNFEVARKALDAGFLPDTISTDLYNLNLNGPVYDLPTTLSKFLHLGMGLEDVLLRATANPAKVIGRIPGLGTLEVGAPADIALLAVEEGQFRLIDSQRNAVTASRRIVSRLTICRGRRLVAQV